MKTTIIENTPEPVTPPPSNYSIRFDDLTAREAGIIAMAIHAANMAAPEGSEVYEVLNRTLVGDHTSLGGVHESALFEYGYGDTEEGGNTITIHNK